MVKRWIVWGVFLIGSVWFASYYGGNIPYLFVKAVAVIPIVELAYCLWVLFRFKYHQEIGQKTVVKCEPVDYRFIINNETKTSFCSIEACYFKDKSKMLGIKDSISYHLKAGDSEETNTHLCCLYRGEYEVGVEKFLIQDYLGLFKIPFHPVSAFKAIVLPRVKDWDLEHTILDEQEERTVQNSKRDGEPDVQVREYIPGDELRQIHWKATARMGKPMSRENCETTKEKVLIAVDLKELGRTETEKIIYEDAVIEQMVSAAYSCFKRSIPCVIAFYNVGWKTLEITYLQQWRDFYEWSGKVGFTAEKSLEELRLSSLKLQGIESAIFITGHMAANLVHQIEKEMHQIKTSLVSIEGLELKKCDMNFETKSIDIYRINIDNQ